MLFVGDISSVVGDEDFLFIHKTTLSPLERDLANRVAFVRFLVGNRWGMCSGFALSDGIFVTNKHCITSQNCASAEIVFDWESETRPSRIWATCTGVLANAAFPASLDEP